MFSSCSDSTSTEPVVPDTGNLIVSSTPAGAQIIIDGTNSGFSTPHTFSDQDAGTYTVTLQLENYADTSMNAVVVKDQDINVNITLTPLYQSFNSIKIYETTGTTAAQPSGLDLSSGNAYGTSDAANRGNIDIYYYSSSDGSTYLVQSASLNSNMTRETYFKVASGTNLNDGTDSEVKGSSWTTSMGDREANYVFLYDADGHYSKLKITSFGGGNVGDPAWLELTWIYNKAKDNILF